MKLKKLSASAIKMYDTCMYKFKLCYLDKVEMPIKGNVYTAFGKAIHLIAQKFYTEKLGTYEKMLELLEPIFDKELKEVDVTLDDDKRKEFIEKGKRCLANFYTAYIGLEEENKFFKNPSEVEKRFELPYKDIVLVGFIDMFSKFEEGAVIDYKTGKNPPTKEDLATDVQLTIYNWAAKQIWNVSPKLFLFFLDLNKKLFTTRTEEDTAKLFKKIDSIIEHVLSDKEFSPNTKMCKYCEYRDVCQFSSVKKNRLKLSNKIVLGK